MDVSIFKHLDFIYVSFSGIPRAGGSRRKAEAGQATTTDKDADLLEVCNVFDGDTSFQTWIGFATILGMNHQERNLAWKKAHR